ncbi:acyl-CoA thioesterase [Sphingomonas sp. CL5.1]|uniref:acyl-CoA thioesterase n=1 Tax=Sphingomonas sp. CL5.1 TaxID=2653203 RepID=UPI0015831C97|nr:thioesterase family protein [Sphingomonas sp. CL5.1]QKS01174.1 acyl-CoA thioesterase [Sphingomonas sp. CL5.1]
MPFTTHAQVRFAHVDPAGIVFYPRYFEMLNGAVEDWFADHLGTDFKTLHLDHHLGIPTVKLDVRFIAPSELGDRLTITIKPRAVGRSSCTLEIVFSGGERDRLRAIVVLVCMDLGSQRATAWPREIAERIRHELEAPDAGDDHDPGAAKPDSCGPGDGRRSTS